jgi:hypothetical protein
MGNYTKMLEANKAANIAKEERAKREITKMLDAGLQVTIADLVKRTGLSRAYFYKNPEVSEMLDKVREQQKGKRFAPPGKIVLDKAMNRQIEILKKENERLHKIIEELTAENDSLKTKMNKSTLNIIKGL